jgi:hypothetical protein
MRSRPDITRPDVRALIRAVPADIVPVAELYRVYCEQMAAQDREPVSKKALGSALEQCGQRATVRAIEGKVTRCRIIREKFMAAEEHDTEPARL